MADRKFRLVTRSDMDGLVAAVLLRDLDMIADIKFAHPKDVQDGLLDLGQDDITVNLPYDPNVYLAFDHHLSEGFRVGAQPNAVIDSEAPSAARVVYDYFGGKQGFPEIPQDMMDAVDKADSANFAREEILEPTGWTLLSFIMDARTGLGRFHHFRISNYQLMMALIDYCRTLTIEQILELPDVKERVELYFDHQEKHRAMLRRLAEEHGPLVVVDIRDEEIIYAGNRFLVYAEFPEAQISMHVMWGKQQQNTVFAVGKSILNPGHPLAIGPLMLEYGGGGHDAAGTCQVPNDQAEQVKQELIDRLAVPG